MYIIFYDSVLRYLYCLKAVYNPLYSCWFSFQQAATTFCSWPGFLFKETQAELDFLIKKSSYQRQNFNFNSAADMNLVVSAALKLSRVNEAYPHIHVISQITLLHWHKLFIWTWDKNRHCPKRIRKRIISSTGCCIVKSLMHTETTCICRHAALMQPAQFSKVNRSSCLNSKVFFTAYLSAVKS